jgi:hypothetical protein
MAARPTGSGADALILYSANDWMDKVHVLDRDCGIETHITDVGKCVADNSCSYLQDSYMGQDPTTVSTALHGDILEGVVLTKNWDPVNGCSESTGTVSILPRTLHASYASNAYRSILGAGQPFSFSGMCALMCRVGRWGTLISGLGERCL